MSEYSIIKETDRLVLEVKYISSQGVKAWNNWRNLRSAVIKEHPYCSHCGWDKRLEAHHIIPRHIDPTKALEYDNIIVLCRKCHFTVGHWCDFVTGHNPDIVYISDIVSRFRKIQTETMNEQKKE